MNLLGNLQVPGSDLSYSTPQLSSQFDVTSVPHQIDPALLQGISSGAAQQQQHHGPFGGGFGNVLGRIGDALLVATGHEPMYAPRVEQQRKARALSNFLGNVEPGLASLIQEVPEVGIKLIESQLQPHEQPADIREYEYAVKNGYTGTYPDWVKLTHPALVAPITLGQYDTYDPTGGGQPSGGGAPPVGTIVGGMRFKGGNHRDPSSWEPVTGGAQASPAPTFPHQP